MIKIVVNINYYAALSLNLNIVEQIIKMPLKRGVTRPPFNLIFFYDIVPLATPTTFS